MLIAVIPARGGSKGIRRKNLRLLNAKPLISYVLEASIASRKIDVVIVTTDDYEIAEYCKHRVSRKKWASQIPMVVPLK